MAVAFDLYEFPEGYSGRKTYVSVQGHSRSIPKMYTYVGADRRNYVLPECGGSDVGFANGAGPTIMPDMAPYRSPLEAGVVISSRPQHRAHMRHHGVVEVGTQPIGTMSVQDRAPINRAGADIARALGKVQ